MSTPNHTGGIDLEGAAELWRTPSSSDDIRGAHPHPDQKAGQHSLTTQADIFPTPAERDYRSPNLVSYQDRGGAMKGEQLPNYIEHSFLPDQPTETDGQPSSESAPTSPRRLNPKFVEWLQGLPEGWTSPEPINSAALATWLCQSRELLRSLLS